MLIGKALVEIPPKFTGKPPVNPEAHAEVNRGGRWQSKGAQGLASDVRYYGKWMRDEAEKRIGYLYPKAKLPNGSEATVIAWLWARTVRSPDPAAKGAMVPLISSFMLSDRDARTAWIVPIIDAKSPDGYRFEVCQGKPPKSEIDLLKRGTKSGRSGFTCLLSGTAIGFDYIRNEATSFGLGNRLLAVLVQDGIKRSYLEATSFRWPEVTETVDDSFAGELLTTPSHDVDRLHMYGMPRCRDAFSNRQLV